MVIKKVFYRGKHMCIVLLLVSLALCFCSYNAGARSVRMKKITINKGKAYTIKGNSKKYTFSSSKPKIAGVTKKGVIKAKKCGTCVITLKKKGRTFRKYKIKVVDEGAVNPGTNATPLMPQLSPAPQISPTPTPPVPDGFFIRFSDGKVSSKKKIDNVSYECYEYVVDYDDAGIQRFKDTFKDFPSVKRILLRSTRCYEVNDRVSLMIEKQCVFKAIDDTTAEISGTYGFE